MINKDMKIKEITEKAPRSVEIMLKHGLHCIGCPIASQETLEQGCQAHGLDDKTIKKIVEEINKK